MITLLLSRVENETLEEVAADNLMYRHDLVRKGPRHLSRFLKQHPVSIIVTKDCLDTEVIAGWAQSTNQPVYVAPFAEAAANDDWRREILTAGVTLIGDSQTVVEALSAAERQICIDRFGERDFTALRDEVTFVGAGIVNLIAAHDALKAGFRVRFIDSRCDPRSNVDWRDLGCSAGGANARMFTFSEMDNYNCRNVNHDMNWQFSRPVSELGWNIAQSDSYTDEDKAWTSSFESIPGWLADSYNDSIFRFNRESHPLWTRWIEDEPELFARSGLRPNILRVYSDRQDYLKSKARQDRIEATLRSATLDDIAAEQPILRAAIEAGEIAGGVYVQGFTLNVHHFMHNLIDRFEKFGVTFNWNTEMTAVAAAQSGGKLDYIELSTGERITGNIVISPGAYAGGVLRNTASHRWISGVLGAWLTLPDPHGGLRNSLKLARKGHITEDANVTVSWNEHGERNAIIGSGYGFTGFNPKNIDNGLLNKVYEGLLDTAVRFFPEQYAQLLESGTLRDTLKYCVRPWTPSGLGVFEVHKSANSCIIVIGGHNTGGFAQAPAISAAVHAAMRNHPHDMHIHYHAERADLMSYTQMPRA